MGGPAKIWISEAGGHRFQRVPPTERRGRVHTSTVTVACIERDASARTELTERDLSVSWFSGTGCGGQHRNKHQNSCRLLHVPTGIVTKSEERSRTASYNAALRALKEKINDQHAAEKHQERVDTTREQVGSGMRGDKIRTYRLQDDVVVDHRSGRRARWRDLERGRFDDLS